MFIKGIIEMIVGTSVIIETEINKYIELPLTIFPLNTNEGDYVKIWIQTSVDEQKNTSIIGV